MGVDNGRDSRKGGNGCRVPAGRAAAATPVRTGRTGRTGARCRPCHAPSLPRAKDAMIDEQLLEILACPEDKSPVHLADDALVRDVNAAIAAGRREIRPPGQLLLDLGCEIAYAKDAFLAPLATKLGGGDSITTGWFGPSLWGKYD